MPTTFPHARLLIKDGIEYWIPGLAIVVGRPFANKSLQPIGSAVVMVDRRGHFLRVPRDRLCLAKDCDRLWTFEEVYGTADHGAIVLGGVDAEAGDDDRDLNLGIAIEEEELDPAR